jgi:glycine/D-amino acid oxidase-like deaminating enzyme
MMTERVVVIGAGLYGSAVAEALTRRGARVTVVDAGQPAGGTSATTFSWINSCGKEPPFYHDFNVAGMAAHRDLADAVPGNDWYHRTGNLQWASDETRRKALREKVSSLLGLGYEARWLTRTEALRLEPDLDPARLPADEIAFFPSEGWIQPPRLVKHLLATAFSRGADLIGDDPVTGLELSASAVRAVTLASSRRLVADAVVNCAGPRADSIARFAGLTLPMRNSRGVLIYTSPVAVSVSRVIHSPRVYLRPNDDGRLLLHCEEIDTAVRGDGIVGPAEIGTALEAASEIYPRIRAATAEHVRIGERPVPGDGLPVLGRADPVPNFHFAVSHSGATLCLHAGDLVAAEILGDDQSAVLAPYRFERFEIR